jgi:DNA-binding transcriptional ArsR family regulator
LYFLISDEDMIHELVSLPYLGSIKGQILKAIAVDSLYQWGEIRDSLGLTDGELRPHIKELKSDGLIEERSSRFRVEYNLWLQYKAHWGDDWAKRKLVEIEDENKRQEELMRILSERKRREAENYLRRRVLKWIEFKKFDVEPDTSHLYLKGDQLDSLLRDLIPLSKKEILVVNPFIQKSAICDIFTQGIKNGVDVQVITRSPETRALELEGVAEAVEGLHRRRISLTAGFTPPDDGQEATGRNIDHFRFFPGGVVLFQLLSQVELCHEWMLDAPR